MHNRQNKTFVTRRPFQNPKNMPLQHDPRANAELPFGKPVDRIPLKPLVKKQDPESPVGNKPSNDPSEGSGSAE